MAVIDAVQLYTSVIGTAALMAVVVFFLYQARGFRNLARRGGLAYQAALLVIFGALAIYGTVSATAVDGVMYNVRDVAPLFAGLVGGPVAGIGAGLIGGLFRLTQGGFTAVPCMIANIAAGALAGLIWLGMRRRVVRPFWGLVLGAVMELIHMGLILLICRPFAEASAVVSGLIGPMLIVNALGLAACLVIFHRLNRLAGDQML